MRKMNIEDAEDLFTDYLDECNPMVTVCGYEYYPSQVLRECDPIAFSCSFNDWCDSEEIELE